MSEGLVKVDPGEEFKGVDLLVHALRALADADPACFDARRTELFSLTLQTAQRLRCDLNTPAGAEQAKMATAQVVNLGLDYLVRDKGRTALDLLSKNALSKIYPIGVKLIQETMEHARQIVERGVVKDQTEHAAPNAFFGLLPYALEQQLRSWQEFVPCATMEELGARRQAFARAERLIALSKYLPLSLVVHGRFIVSHYDFVRWRFLRPGRSQPSIHGGIVDPLVWTIMVKCILGRFLRPGLRPQVYSEGASNWWLNREEILTFVRLVVLEPHVLNDKIEQAMAPLEYFFLKDAILFGAKTMKKGELDSWGETLQEIFLRLVEEVKRFYQAVPSEITAEAIETFWASRIVIEKERHSKGELHDVQVPRLSQLLELPLNELEGPLSGFWGWPPNLRRRFVEEYAWTRKIKLREREIDFRDIGQEVNAVLRCLMPAQVSATQETQALARCDPTQDEHWAQRALQRLQIDQLTLQIIFSLYVHGPEWVRVELLARAGDYRYRLADFLEILKHGSRSWEDGDDRWLRLVLQRFKDLDKLTTRHREHWQEILDHAPLIHAFPLILELCPPTLRADLLSFMVTTELGSGLRRLSAEQRRELLMSLDPTRVPSLEGEPDQEWVRVLHETLKVHLRRIRGY